MEISDWLRDYPRDLITFDVEATGTDPDVDRIIQLGVISKRVGQDPQKFQTLINPGIPIPPESQDIHGLSDDDVADAPRFSHLANRLHKAFDGCDFCGYNVRFDLGMIRAEFTRAGKPLQLNSETKILDPSRIFKKMFPRDLEAACMHYLCEELPGAHDAMVDTEATLRIMMAQVQAHGDHIKRESVGSPAALESMPVDPQGLSDFCLYDDEGIPLDCQGKFQINGDKVIISFSKHRGSPASEVPASFYGWMLRQDFMSDAKTIAAHYQNGGDDSRFIIDPELSLGDIPEELS